MPRFKQIIGNYVPISADFAIPVPSDFQKGEMTNIGEQIAKDLPRTNYVSFQYSAKELKQRLEESKMSFYTQGDFDAGVFSEIYTKVKNPRFLQMVDAGFTSSICKTIRMAYIDDESNNCGVAISYLNKMPLSLEFIRSPDEEECDFIISVIRNTTSAPNDRTVTIISSYDLLIAEHQTLGDEVDAAGISQAINTALNSKEMSELLAGLIKEDGSLSKPTFTALSARFHPGYNIDMRDEQAELLKVIMYASRVNNPDFKDYLDKIKGCVESNINFYKDSTFILFKDHIRLMSDYEESLSNYNEETSSLAEKNLYKRGCELLHYIKTEALLNEKSLPLLNRALKSGAAALENPADSEAVKEMTALSQECSGKASSFWKKLGGALLFFAAATLVVAGVLAAIPSGGSSLLLTVLGATGLAAGIAGGGAIIKGREQGMAKSFSHFKRALSGVSKNEQSSEDFANLPGFGQ